MGHATAMGEVRVLELGSGVSAAHAAGLLADQGADVVKVEDALGDRTRRRGPFPSDQLDPEQSGLFLALNKNKRGVSLDLDDQDARTQLTRLIDWADILIHNYPRARAEELGLAPAVLEASHPHLVVLSLTPFGITGPYRDFRAEELTLSNAGGWANLCPAATGRTDLPPLKVFGEQCSFMAAVAGATATMAAYFDAARTGVGEHIDLSIQEYVASVLENGVPQYTYAENVATRYAPRMLIPWSIFQASDGPIFLVCVEQDQWERLVELMGRPEWTGLEVFADVLGRAENQDLVHGFVQEWIGERTVDELYHQGQKRRICFAPVMSLAQMSESEHLREREFFVEAEHPRAGRLRYLGSPIRTRAGGPSVRRAAPQRGEHNDEVLRGTPQPRERGEDSGAVRLPLEGIRVVDLSWAWAGPFCAMNLAHLGAEVIRFESEGRPDLYRRLPIIRPGTEPGLNRSGMFNQWNQGKKSVSLNMSEPRAIELLKDVVATSDVVVENFATGVMDRLGIGYDVLREVNPRVILASVTGYGQTGPYRSYMGYGPAIPPLTGLAAATGFVGGAPREIGISMPDPTAGITAAFAICAALQNRELTGEGERLDISLWEATAALTAEAWMEYAMNGKQPERAGNRDRWMSPHGCFKCSGEDDWVSIACADDDEWRALCGVLDPTLADDPRFRNLAQRKRNEDELEKRIEAWTLERDRWAVTHELQAVGVAAFPSFTPKDVAEDAHLNERGFLERLPHPEVGTQTHTGIPWRLRRRPNGVRSAAPVLGADTEEVLTKILGYSSEQIAELRNDKVLL